MNDSVYRSFSAELNKEANSKLINAFSKTLSAAGKHPKTTIGLAGGLLLASQIPSLANKALGVYIMRNEPKKRKIMKSQVDILKQIQSNTSPKSIIIDTRKIPIVEDLA